MSDCKMVSTDEHHTACAHLYGGNMINVKNAYITKKYYLSSRRHKKISYCNNKRKRTRFESLLESILSGIQSHAHKVDDTEKTHLKTINSRCRSVRGVPPSEKSPVVKSIPEDKLCDKRSLETDYEESLDLSYESGQYVEVGNTADKETCTEIVVDSGSASICLHPDPDVREDVSMAHLKPSLEELDNHNQSESSIEENSDVTDISFSSSYPINTLSSRACLSNLTVKKNECFDDNCNSDLTSDEFISISYSNAKCRVKLEDTDATNIEVLSVVSEDKNVHNPDELNKLKVIYRDQEAEHRKLTEIKSSEVFDETNGFDHDFDKDVSGEDRDEQKSFNDEKICNLDGSGGSISSKEDVESYRKVPDGACYSTPIMTVSDFDVVKSAAEVNVENSDDDSGFLEKHKKSYDSSTCENSEVALPDGYCPQAVSERGCDEKFTENSTAENQMNDKKADLCSNEILVCENHVLANIKMKCNLDVSAGSISFKEDVESYESYRKVPVGACYSTPIMTVSEFEVVKSAAEVNVENSDDDSGFLEKHKKSYDSSTCENSEVALLDGYCPQAVSERGCDEKFTENSLAENQMNDKKADLCSTEILFCEKHVLANDEKINLCDGDSDELLEQCQTCPKSLLDMNEEHDDSKLIYGKDNVASDETYIKEENTVCHEDSFDQLSDEDRTGGNNAEAIHSDTHSLPSFKEILDNGIDENDDVAEHFFVSLDIEECMEVMPEDYIDINGCGQSGMKDNGHGHDSEEEFTSVMCAGNSLHETVDTSQEVVINLHADSKVRNREWYVAVNETNFEDDQGMCTSEVVKDITTSNDDDPTVETSCMGFAEEEVVANAEIDLMNTNEENLEGQHKEFSSRICPLINDCKMERNNDDKHRKKIKKSKKVYRKTSKRLTRCPHAETSSLESVSWHEQLSYNVSWSSYHQRPTRPHQRNKWSDKKEKKINKDKPSLDDLNGKLAYSAMVDSGVGVSLEKSSWFIAIAHYDNVSSKHNCCIKKRRISFKAVNSLRMTRNINRFRQQCKSFFKNRTSRIVNSIVRELHIRNQDRTVFGLGSYFDRFNNGPPPPVEERMRYEWLRLASFTSYTGAGNAIKLARQGFYHNSTDDPTSTRCVYCNMTYNEWGYFDDIDRIHRQRSPDCPYHGDRSQASMNVPISDDTPQSTVNNTSTSVTNSNTSTSSTVEERSTSNTPVEGNTPVESNASNMTVEKSIVTPKTLTAVVNDVSRNLEETHVSQARPANESIESVPQQPSEDPEGRQTQLGQGRSSAENVQRQTRTSGNAPLPHSRASTPRNRYNAGAGNFLEPNPVYKHTHHPPPSTDRPTTEVLENIRHPDYRTMGERISSYGGFPPHLDQTPELMALAGFFYVGVADFTRCFCCGGGLRNWEAGDDPMLEHTRWFPHCEYVRRLKGERFVEAVQRRHLAHMEAQRQAQQQLASERDAERNATDPLSTDAAHVLREMGFSEERIRETVLEVRRRNGSNHVTPQQLVTFLLDRDPIEENWAGYQRLSDTNSVYTGVNMMSEVHANDALPSNQSNYTTALETNVNSAVSTTAVKTRENVQGSDASRNSPSNNGNKSSETQNVPTGTGTTQGTKASPSQPTQKKNGRKKKNRNGATSSGAAKSSEIDTVRKLQVENEKLKDMQTCKICMEREVNTTLLPCGHLVSCEECAKKLKECPICKKKIVGTIKTFMS
ncbi:E3 ubiquitin-protein ligase mib2 [Mactra antiquata]